MATTAMQEILLTLLLAFIFMSLLPSHASADGCFSSIISFGDSLSDTGNLLVVERNDTKFNPFTDYFGRLPYGTTYFSQDSGRASDGRIVIDFVAQALGLPFVPPYLAGPDNNGFKKGVNFAVTGANALDKNFFASKGMQVAITNLSWSDQNEWFKKLQPSLCNSKQDCNKFFGSSLIFVGEIGANDYNYAFIQNRTLTEMKSWIPKIINKTSKTIEMLVGLGARTVVVPNNPPVGCRALYLTFFSGSKDEQGCLNFYNDFVISHNQQLLDEVNHLRKRFPNVTLIYADFYNAIYSIIKSARQRGFVKSIGACCGGGGPFNYNLSAICGTPAAKVCSDPSKYVDWDGIHYTEAAYKIVANGFLQGPFATPPILLQGGAVGKEEGCSRAASAGHLRRDFVPKECLIVLVVVFQFLCCKHF